MKNIRFTSLLVVITGGALWLAAQQPQAPQGGAPGAPGGAAGRGAGGPGGPGGGGGRARTRKAVLAWADTRNGQAQHDSVTHALTMIERLGYETGLWDTYIRTDSDIISYTPKMTTGQNASGGPSLANVDAIFFMGHRAVPITDEQKPQLLKFVHDDGKGFVSGHVGLTAMMDWPEFGEMMGGQYDNHPFGTFSSTVINEDPTNPIVKGFPATYDMRDEFYVPKLFSREKSRVLLRLDVTKLPTTGMGGAPVTEKREDWPLAWIKAYGQGRVFYTSFGHDATIFDNPYIYHMYFEAMKWALKLQDVDMTPRSLAAAIAAAPPAPAPRTPGAGGPPAAGGAPGAGRQGGAPAAAGTPAAPPKK